MDPHTHAHKMTHRSILKFLHMFSNSRSKYSRYSRASIKMNQSVLEGGVFKDRGGYGGSGIGRIELSHGSLPHWLSFFFLFLTKTLLTATSLFFSSQYFKWAVLGRLVICMLSPFKFHVIIFLRTPLICLLNNVRVLPSWKMSSNSIANIQHVMVCLCKYSLSDLLINHWNSVTYFLFIYGTVMEENSDARENVIQKTLRMRKNTGLWFISEWTIRLRPIALPFKWNWVMVLWITLGDLKIFKQKSRTLPLSIYYFT